MIDGQADDACWQGLPVMETFYQYWSPTPKPPPLKTAARLCFDATGLYLLVTLWDDRLDTVRATIRDRDNPLTWTDDCVEIMIDPHNTGDSYYKFCTNSNAARYDERATHLELNGGWNAEGWKSATSKGEGEWTIEFALPWSDIDAKPRDGEVWSFDLVRYSFSTGSFRGVTWSLGGAGAAPRNFGYLGFGRFPIDKTAYLERIARAAAKTKGQTFYLLAGDEVVTRDGPGSWRRTDLRAWAAEPLTESGSALDEAYATLETLPIGDSRRDLHAKLDDLGAQLRELRGKAAGDLPPAEAAVLRQEGLTLRRAAVDLKWRTMVIELVQRQ